LYSVRTKTFSVPGSTASAAPSDAMIAG
jgi:hypothetical protein